MGKLLHRNLLNGLLTATSVLSLAACPQHPLVSTGEISPHPASVSLPSQGSSVALTSSPAAEKAKQNVSFEVCANLPTWARSPESIHLKQLQDMPRYGSALNDEPLKSLLKSFWSHQVISFTTYGLSARTEPLYFSGVWTALEGAAACYNGDQPEQINAGSLAEVWLINHRLVDLQWTDGQYMLTVEPTDQGLQVIQFSRQDSAPTLALSVVTPEGNSIEPVSGDW